MTLPLAISENTANIAYVIAAICFIVGMRLLGSPGTARRGNIISAFGMLLAIAFTLALPEVDDYWLVVPALAVGAGIGATAARRVRITAMPQMVALFNGVGGGASVLVAWVEFERRAPLPGALPGDFVAAALFGALIGGITFTGSVLAFAKLQELLPGRPLVFPAQNLWNGAILAAMLGLAVAAGATEATVWISLLIALSLAFGALFVLPIGGADMPVVIAFLNAFSGLAAVAAGFVLSNNALVIGGTLVGASGTLLTVIMCRAMNRSLTNVFVGAFGARAAATAAADAPSTDGKTHREITAEDAAVMLAYARQVVIVPGYGLAVAQAQHNVRELADLLEKRGVAVKYAIHPVAGRMPGHMNVLLAEANVPYPQLYDMEDINPEFPRTDVALVIGANDVTNPAARSTPSSPIYGMPILDVDHAANVIVLKRSMAAGFAGIENELYYDSKTAMLFGDAKASVEKLVAGVKAV